MGVCKTKLGGDHLKLAFSIINKLIDTQKKITNCTSNFDNINSTFKNLNISKVSNIT